MTRNIALIAVAIAVVLGTAYYANSQQMDGTNCEWAYKKLQQHRNYGYCNEQGSDAQQGKDFKERGAKADGEHSIRDRVGGFIDRLRD